MNERLLQTLQAAEGAPKARRLKNCTLASNNELATIADEYGGALAIAEADGEVAEGLKLLERNGLKAFCGQDRQKPVESLCKIGWQFDAHTAANVRGKGRLAACRKTSP